MRIKKGDSVKILTGKDVSKIGLIERVVKKKNRAIVKGLNIYKKHVKHSRKTPKGGVIDIAVSLHLSNLQLVCPKCEKPTKIKFVRKNDKKIRTCKKCKAQFE